MKCDPAGVPSHDLQDHDPLMTGRRGMESIQRVGGAGNRAVETERKRGRGQIIVNGLWHSHHGNAKFMKLLSDRQGPISTNADQTTQA